MLRVFGHYIAFPALSLALAEAIIFFGLMLILTTFNLPDLGIIKMPSEAEVHIIVVATLVSFITLASLGMYNRQIFFNMQTVVERAIVIFPVMFVVQWVVMILYAQMAVFDYKPYYVLSMIAMVIYFPLILIIRGIFVNLDIFQRRVLVLGAGGLAARIQELMHQAHRPHFTVVGYRRFPGDQGGEHLAPVLDADQLSESEALVAFVIDNKIDEVVVAVDERRRSSSQNRSGLPVEGLLECKLLGVRVSEYQAFWERESGQVDLDNLRPSWLIFSDGFKVNLLRRCVKRVFDIAVSLLVLVLTLPITLVTAILIRATSPGPIFYRQERVGQNGRAFDVLKFRSMREDAEKSGVPQWATHKDDRITGVGRFIRAARIDELPQVINVLKGDMSFIGPRPERPFFVADLSETIPFYGERHRVKPGITGWAQINYPYGASVEDARRKLAYDLYYVKNDSLFLDVLILAQTLRVVLWSEGAR